jgi:hypothetical protein
MHAEVERDPISGETDLAAAGSWSRILALAGRQQ